MLRQFNSGFNNGFQQFEEDLFSTCNVHALAILCDDELHENIDVPERFCPSHCKAWSEMVLSHCKPGQLPADMELALRNKIAACGADVAKR